MCGRKCMAKDIMAKEIEGAERAEDVGLGGAG